MHIRRALSAKRLAPHAVAQLTLPVQEKLRQAALGKDFFAQWHESELAAESRGASGCWELAHARRIEMAEDVVPDGYYRVGAAKLDELGVGREIFHKTCGRSHRATP
jgi:hypothetical protein